MLMKATNYKVGEPCDELEEVYGRMVGQWTTEMGHVVADLGGVDSQQKHIGQDGAAVRDGRRGRGRPRRCSSCSPARSRRRRS